MLPEILILTIISISILMIRKRKFDFSIVKLEIKGYQVLIIAAVIEITAEFLFHNFNHNHNDLMKILSNHWLIYFAIFIITLLNIKKPFMKLIFIGTLLNFIAIVSNDFKMPVLVSDVLSNTEAKKLYLQSGGDLIHSLLTEDTKFKFLCDIITLPPPYPYPKTISIGDLLLLFGIFLAWHESDDKKNGKVKSEH